MKLNPEIKQIRKDLVLATNIIIKQTEQSKRLRESIDRKNKFYFETFIYPYFQAKHKDGSLILTPREQKVLELRFSNRMTLEELSKYFDVTRERIRQIEYKAIEKIKHFIRTI